MFDVNQAYIMAEATQTLSLEDDNTHEPGDQLWSKQYFQVPLLKHPIDAHQIATEGGAHLPGIAFVHPPRGHANT